MCSQRDNETSHGSQSGFSMIEMMIAVVVILVGLVSIVGISVYVARANYTSNTLNVLASAAQDQVDRLRTAVWNTSTEDPSLSEGGSLEIATPTPSSPTSTMSASSTSQSPTEIYAYAIDPDSPHSASVANTPAGDLRISWQVRQGATPDLRYVTIRVAQANPSRGLERGFTVSTIIVRN